MELYVLRHTSAAGPHAFSSDAERPLTEAGRFEAAEIGSAMPKLGFLPELALTSPYRRAKETARIVTDILRIEPPEECEFLAPGAHPEDLMKELSSRTVGSILVVGHAPDVAHLVTAICFGEAPSGFVYAKGTLAAIDVERPVRKRSGLLRALLPLQACTKAAEAPER